MHTATRWDPDGAGPAPEVVVVGGDFVINTTPVANELAQFDPATGTWSPFANTSFNGKVTALVPMPNGDLVAAGLFSYVSTPGGNLFVGTVARWNGVSWGSLFFPGTHVNAAVALPNGDLVVGSDVGIQRWNGSTWMPLGTTGRVAALAVLPGGTVAAAWYQPMQPGVFALNIATWNGTAWATICNTPYYNPNSPVLPRLAALPNGHLVAVGEALNTGTGSPIVEWNGSAWLPMGYGSRSFPPLPVSVCVLANGDLVVGSMLRTNGSVTRWNGSVWSAVGSRMGHDNVAVVVEVANGDLLAFDVQSGPGTLTIADRWNGATWSRVASGTDGQVRALLTMPDGTLVAAGDFTYLGGAPAKGIARWNGVSWAPLGTAPASAGAVARFPNGDLIAGGYFTNAGGTSAFNIERWNGSNWLALGTLSFPLYTISSAANALAVLPNGTVVAAVSHLISNPIAGLTSVCQLLLWNGISWSLPQSVTALGNPGLVRALAVMPNGDVIATGYFSHIGGVAAAGIARWNGTTWSGLGSGIAVGTGYCLLPLANGDLIVGGVFPSAGGAPAPSVARWNGTAWSSMGSGTLSPLLTLLQLPDGDILAAGSFSFLDPLSRRADGLARWNGTNWFATRINQVSGAGGFGASAIMGTGEIALGGFLSLGTAASGYFGRVASTCPAAAAPVGNGCPSSGGSNTLRAETLPWLGSASALMATGLPPIAVAVAGFGTTPIPRGNLPLASVSALAGPGCDVLVVPDLLQILVANGTARVALVVPNVAALIGASVHTQMAIIETDVTGTPLAITSTNAVQLIVGSLCVAPSGQPESLPVPASHRSRADGSGHP